MDAMMKRLTSKIMSSNYIFTWSFFLCFNWTDVHILKVWTTWKKTHKRFDWKNLEYLFWMVVRRISADSLQSFSTVLNIVFFPKKLNKVLEKLTN